MTFDTPFVGSYKLGTDAMKEPESTYAEETALEIDIHEQARGTLIIQASLDLKLGKYYLKKSE